MLSFGSELHDRLPIPSRARIITLSLFGAALVLGLSLSIQWLIYADLLGEHGPIRLVGTVIAGCLTFAFAYRWQAAERERRSRMIARFEMIAQMNDRIRNALQQIECVMFVNQPEATAPVRDGVERIDQVLREVLSAIEIEQQSGVPEAQRSAIRSRRKSA